MIIGVPKEIKKFEFRVAITPSGVKTLVNNGHRILVQQGAGDGSGISDEAYRIAGAEIVNTAENVFKKAEMILKVKEPLPDECKLLSEGQILFCYLHLAANQQLVESLLMKKVIAIAYETVQMPDGLLPLLEPMSAIAGKIAVQAGAYYLQKNNGGRGVLLGGVPGIHQGNVVIIGGGTVGSNAARVALGMGAKVSVLDINLNRLNYLNDIFDGRLTTLASSRESIEDAIAQADLVIGATLKPGAKAPKLVTREMLAGMCEGSVIVDVAIDQGGCCETSRPTTHDNPVYTVDGVLHYCVTNMPSAVARSATFALTNATLPYTCKIADLGYYEALLQDKSLRKGLNVYQGKLVSSVVAESLGIPYVPLEDIGFLSKQ